MKRLTVGQLIGCLMDYPDEADVRMDVIVAQDGEYRGRYDAVVPDRPAAVIEYPLGTVVIQALAESESVVVPNTTNCEEEEEECEG